MAFTRQQGFSLLELILVLVVIGILAAKSLEYYNNEMDDARRVGVETLSNNFTAAVGGIHAQWIVSGKPEQISVDNMPVFVNRFGWPVGGERFQQQSAKACVQLWQTILQNPAQASVEGESDYGSRRYHISALDVRTCRYELVTNDKGSHYFDYSTYTGQVLAVVPPLN